MATTEFRLANVLLEDGDRSKRYPDLYYHLSERPHVMGEGLDLGGAPARTFDFATYLNALSWCKWRCYTVADNAHLRLRMRGRAHVTYVGWWAAPEVPRREVLGERDVDLDQVGEVDFAYPDTDATLLAFEVETAGDCTLAGGYYYTCVDEGAVRPVELALATTTFRNERYILPNIRLIEEGVLGCDEPIASHFTLHVVDNGRTLDAQGLSHGRVQVHPNPNVGGSGGFARGMIEARHQEAPATHVLLMDDDVSVLPESLKRTFNLLSLVRDEWADAFVSGAMMSFEEQDLFFEDAGAVIRDQAFGSPQKVQHHMGSLANVIGNEWYEPHRTNGYAGWWYCCIPMSQVGRKGLPLPLFIRGDDVEFGNRCQPRIMTMNGICVWHLTFPTKFRVALERYQWPRNGLIAQAATGVYQGIDFVRALRINFNYDLKVLYYDSAELSIRALEDYLRGPDWLERLDQARYVRELGKAAEVPVPLDQIADPDVQAANFNPEELFEAIEEDEAAGRDTLTRAFDYLTMNGHRLPGFEQHGGLAIMPLDGWFYDPDELRGANRILLVTRDGREGVLRAFDRGRKEDLERRFHQALADYDRRHAEVDARWAQAGRKFVTEDFWQHYLAYQAKA